MQEINNKSTACWSQRSAVYHASHGILNHRDILSTLSLEHSSFGILLVSIDNFMILHFFSSKSETSKTRKPPTPLGKKCATTFSLFPGFRFTNHAQEYSLSFSPRFAIMNVTQLLIG